MNNVTLAVRDVQLYKLHILTLVQIPMHDDVNVGIDVSVVVDFDFDRSDFDVVFWCFYVVDSV